MGKGLGMGNDMWGDGRRETGEMDAWKVSMRARDKLGCKYVTSALLTGKGILPGRCDGWE